MEELTFEQPTQCIVMQEYVEIVGSLTKRIQAFDEHIERAASACALWPIIEALMALRGMNLLTATCFAAEIGDLKRFATAPQLMAYLGLVPSEHSSGAKQSRGGITKTGNGHVRRLLIEAAWTYRHPARKSKVIQRRAERTPQAVQDIAWKAQTRLCSRYRRLEARSNAMTLEHRARQLL
jgi:transposase